jgi:hypothetical protein
VGTVPEDEKEKCTASGVVFNTASGCYTMKGEKLEIPPGDTSLTSYVKAEDKLSGQTQLKLNGTSIEEINSAGVKSTLPWPSNGLIYVSEGSSCSYPFHPWLADTLTEFEETKGCGNVYVSGHYSEPLTIAAENNIIVNGNLYPTGTTLGNAPTGTATLGLIANNYVRVYHPVTSTGSRTEGSCNAENQNAEQDPSKLGGTMTNPYIYAAILSTKHSFLNDNPDCGGRLEDLNIYGAIGQDYRGIVGVIGTHGYTKDY